MSDVYRDDHPDPKRRPFSDKLAEAVIEGQAQTIDALYAVIAAKTRAIYDRDREIEGLKGDLDAMRGRPADG